MGKHLADPAARISGFANQRVETGEGDFELDTETDLAIIGNASSASIVTLPRASSLPHGRSIVIKRSTGSVGVTVRPFAGDRIDGATNDRTIAAAGDAVQLTAMNSGSLTIFWQVTGYFDAASFPTV